MKIIGFKKMVLAISVAAAAIGGASAPALARGHYYDGYNYGGHYGGRTPYNAYNGYDGYRGYNGYRSAYRSSGYNPYRGQGYRYRDCRRDDGVGGAVIGAIAGGLLGNTVARHGDKTTGTVIGGAVGAVAGNLIDKGDGRC